jgi:hypothetical protein
MQKRKRGVNKKAQTALFVIIAVALVAVVALLLFLKPGKIAVAPKVTEPQAYIEKCMKDSATESLVTLRKQGGSLSPQAYALYNNNKVAFLCYTTNYYSKCVNQQPMLKYHVENEITGYTYPKVQQCISQMKAQLEKLGYTVTTGSLSLSTTLQPKKIVIDVSLPLTITKEETKKFEKFQAAILSPIYEHVILAQDIVNSEINYGDFDQLSYMLYKSGTDIDKKMSGESTVYTLTDRNNQQSFLFAVRSYVMPPGF